VNIPVAIVLVALIMGAMITVSTRYSLQPHTGDKDVIGAWRLDRWTGTVAQCRAKCFTLTEQSGPN